MAHDYNPQQALELLMRKLKERNEALATQLQESIDEGKDVEEREDSSDRRKKPRIYRKKVAFTPDEALQVALDALQAYFVEQPKFVESSANEFAKAALGSRRTETVRLGDDDALDELELDHESEREDVELTAQGAEKAIGIELQTETQISRASEETTSLKRTSPEEIEKQSGNIHRLRELFTFKDE